MTDSAHRAILPYDWIFHSVTPVHIATRRAMFQSYITDVSGAPDLENMDGKKIKFVGKGTVLLDIRKPNGSGIMRLELKDVYHDPTALACSFSMIAVAKQSMILPSLQLRPLAGLSALPVTVVRREDEHEYYITGSGKDAEIVAEPPEGYTSLTSYPKGHFALR